MADQAVALVVNEAGGRSVAIMERCMALKLSEQDITAVTQLAEMPAGEPIDALLQYVEDGMTVPRIAECIRLRTDSESVEGCNISALGKVIGMIDFSHTNIVKDLEADPSKIIVGGNQMSINEYENIVLSQIVNGDASVDVTQRESIFAPHVEIIDSLIEFVRPICGLADPAVFLLQGLEQYFDSNPLMAYYVFTEDPEEFATAMFAGLDPEVKLQMVEKLSEEESKDFLCGIGLLGITPESLGLSHLCGSSDSDKYPEDDSDEVEEVPEEDYE